MKTILQFLAGQTFAVDADWGIAKVKELMMQQHFGADIAYFNKAKLDMMNVEYQSPNGVYIGNDAELIDKGSIAIVSLQGPMMVNDGLCSIGMNTLSKILTSQFNNPRVAGVMLEVDSGGGESIAGDIMLNALADKNKPVVVHATMMASAALKAAIGADEIISISDSVWVGSIGSMAVVNKSILDPENSETLEIYSRKSPNKNRESRAMRQGDFEPFIDRITVNDEHFMSAVKKYRKLKGDRTTIKNTLSGELFDSKTAKRRGLIDGIGTKAYALKRLKSHISYNS